MATLSSVVKSKLQELVSELDKLQEDRAAFAQWKRAGKKRMQKEAEALAAWKQEERRAMDEERANLTAWTKEKRAELANEKAEFAAWKQQALDRLEPTRRYKAEIASLKEAAAKVQQDGEEVRRRALTRRRRLDEKVKKLEAENAHLRQIAHAAETSRVEAFNALQHRAFASDEGNLFG